MAKKENSTTSDKKENVAKPINKGIVDPKKVENNRQKVIVPNSGRVAFVTNLRLCPVGIVVSPRSITATGTQNRLSPPIVVEIPPIKDYPVHHRFDTHENFLIANASFINSGKIFVAEVQQNTKKEDEKLEELSNEQAELAAEVAKQKQDEADKLAEQAKDNAAGLGGDIETTLGPK